MEPFISFSVGDVICVDHLFATFIVSSAKAWLASSDLLCFLYNGFIVV